MPGLSDNVFKLPSIVHISAGSSISTSENNNLSFDDSDISQSSLSLMVSSSFFDVSDLFK